MRPSGLSVPIPWRGSEDGLFLVRATDGLRLCRGGAFEALPSWGSAHVLHGLGAQTTRALRDFAAQARLFSARLSDLGDAQVVALIQTALKRGDLALLKSGDGDAAGDGSTRAVQNQLVKAIAAKTRNRLSLAGRQYRLVADAGLAKVADRESYEVVRHDDAVKVLQSIGKEAGAGPGLVDLMARANALLTRDWRPPMAPDGLVLLRKLPARQSSSAPSQPALTPSQIKKALVKTEWIEIVLTDDLGKPYTGPYEIQLPDGTTATGTFDEQGMFANYDIDPGTCKMVVPGVPESVKPGKLTTFIAIKVVDEDGNPIEGYSYTLALPDGGKREGTTDDQEIRAEGIDPGDCVFKLSMAS